MKSKKAMMVGQIFVYSLSLIIVAMILLFGYKIIVDFLGSSGQVEYLQFKKQVEGYVKRYSTEYASVGLKDLRPPVDVREICFTDYNWQFSTNLVDCGDCAVAGDSHIIIKDSFTEKPREKKNFFLLGKEGKLIDSYYIGNISLASMGGCSGDCNYLCIVSQRGVIPIKIIARGDHVIITNSTKA